MYDLLHLSLISLHLGPLLNLTCCHSCLLCTVNEICTFGAAVSGSIFLHIEYTPVTLRHQKHMQNDDEGKMKMKMTKKMHNDYISHMSLLCLQLVVLTSND